MQKNESGINVKTTKREYAFKGFASSYNVWIFDSFNPEPQLKNTESAIKKESKIYWLISEDSNSFQRYF